MLPELLVVLACTTGSGCSQTSGHYYNNNPEAQYIIKKNQRQLKQYLGPIAVTIIGPLLIGVSGGTGTIKLGSNFSLQTKKDSSMILFIKEF